MKCKTWFFSVAVVIFNSCYYPTQVVLYNKSGTGKNIRLSFNEMERGLREEQGPAPAIGTETGCHYYYNRSLKKNVYTSWEIEPEFPGGAAAYVRFLIKNLRIPQDTVEDVTILPMPRIKFIVDTDGQILNPCIQGKNDSAQLNSLEKAEQ